MLLDTADLGEEGWEILKEKIWTERVLVDSSSDMQDAPRSTMATRHFGTKARSLEGLWTHVIPTPSSAKAEALSVTLLHRIRPNPESEVTELNPRWLEGIHLKGTSNVKVLQKDTIGMGATGRVLYMAGAVNNVAFGMCYGSLGDGWTQDHFVRVAQGQADKICSQTFAV